MNVETGRAVVPSCGNYDLPGIPLAFYGSGRRLDSRGLIASYAFAYDSFAHLRAPYRHMLQVYDREMTQARKEANARAAR